MSSDMFKEKKKNLKYKKIIKMMFGFNGPKNL